MDRFSFLNAIDPQYLGELYNRYLQYPDSVEPSWRAFFQGFDFANTPYGEINTEESNQNRQTEDRLTYQETSMINSGMPEKLEKEFKVINLIDGYRKYGHLFTKTNPVRERRHHVPTLDPENFGLGEKDLDETFDAGSLLGMGGPATLRNIIGHLQNMYCSSIGVEYMYIRKPDKKQWIQNWLNQHLNHPQFSAKEKERILLKLNEAVAFESFLNTKYVGQKRFSLEGNETLIPALDTLINLGAEMGVEEVNIGMAHRGRLNVLANIFKKSYSQIFSEFEGKEFMDDELSGDVKYHLGSSQEVMTESGKKMVLNLAPNPSHLESVGAITEGLTRASIENQYGDDYKKSLPVIMHGDAAIAAQGIAYEIIQMMNLDGYKTGGTIHIVINNQIGFTTNYLDGRSSVYCTDLAKVTDSPVMHVNADDAEAVVLALNFAIEYRMKFGEDVFIDLLGYRKYGHNEGDEPKFTQPQLYKIIAKHPNAREIYAKKLLEEGAVGKEIVEKKEEEFKQLLDDKFEESKTVEKIELEPFMPEQWKDIKLVNTEEMLEPVDTTFPMDRLKHIAEAITTQPEDKKLFRKTARLLKQRREMVENDKLDWAMGELLAYGTAVEEGYPTRLSGEDVERGTFSHRHAVMITEDTEEEVILLNHISDKQARFTVYNSLLSEYAVLGFDYGYAMAAPHGLTLWEAQFGDFANGGQIIIDQYISAAEDKWKVKNGLVMLLPHGYEGQGAEHSSGRMERFLQMSAQGNWFVVNCTTPANFFHALRRQFKADYRKPLIAFTPKSLLRHPKVISTMEDLSKGGFQTVIDDPDATAAKTEKLVFCQGKIYYDLLKKKEELNAEGVALVRIEQLYPLDKKKIEEILKKYNKRKKLIWAQEEPENMGAWGYLLRVLSEVKFELISPSASASPAEGSHRRAEIIHNKVINQVFE